MGACCPFSELLIALLFHGRCIQLCWYRILFFLIPILASSSARSEETAQFDSTSVHRSLSPPISLWVSISLIPLLQMVWIS
jgi:hypothetical protein